MTIEQIIADAKNHIGMEMTASEFKWAFRMSGPTASMAAIRHLLDKNVLVVSRTAYRSGKPVLVYKVAA